MALKAYAVTLCNEYMENFFSLLSFSVLGNNFMALQLCRREGSQQERQKVFLVEMKENETMPTAIVAGRASGKEENFDSKPRASLHEE
jgi:predicted secreted protein